MIRAMSTWRTKAARLFPQLKPELNSKEFTIYMVFTDLCSWAREAHQSGDDDLLRKIYGFSAWCLRQEAKDLWNAAGVSFYEHLIDEPKLWAEIVPWLSPRVIGDVHGLWEARLDPEAMSKFDKLIRDRKKIRYQELESAP